MEGVERIEVDGQLVAVVLRAAVRPDGVRFFTSDDSTMQMGLLEHRAGTKIAAHMHRDVRRIISHTLEVLHLRSGKIEVQLYGEHHEPAVTVQAGAGDTILLVSGGHGLRVLEDSLILEVKQGPYLGVDDKERL